MWPSLVPPCMYGPVYKAYMCEPGVMVHFLDHIPLPHRHDKHHADTPNLQSPDLANQSPPSLTPDLESCHNSHQVVAQKVKEAEITHGQQDSLLLVYISQQLTIQFSLFLSS
ncbi:hypothetical protein Peur_025153 [Populus x canadensis]